MTTVLETLKGINAYPVPFRTFVEIAEVRGLPLVETAKPDILISKAYKLAKADLYLWLSVAPNITQGGQSYSFTDEQRQWFANKAKALYKDCGEEVTEVKAVFGYKGSRL